MFEYLSTEIQYIKMNDMNWIKTDNMTTKRTPAKPFVRLMEYTEHDPHREYLHEMH